MKQNQPRPAPPTKNKQTNAASHAPLAPNDSVMVEAVSFKLPMKFHKLGPLCIGPFKVLKQINEVTFQLELTKDSKMYPGFHSSQLICFKGDAPTLLDPIDLANPGEELYEVEPIIATHTTREKLHFLVKWRSHLSGGVLAIC